MARSNLTDYLQVYPFWLFDAFPIEPNSLPVFNPLLGFSSITAPEISANEMPIREGNWHYPRKVIKDADIGNMTLTRAATFFDNDFYKWIITAIEGDPLYFAGSPLGVGGLQVGGATPRRNLVLVHFLSRLPLPSPDAVGSALVDGGVEAQTPSTPSALGAAVGTGSVGPFEIFAARLPARAWFLEGCIPLRYKPGGDFDAMSSAISIQELDIGIENIDQISLAI